jgi:hypothetical protein
MRANVMHRNMCAQMRFLSENVIGLFVIFIENFAVYLVDILTYKKFLNLKKLI